MSDFFTILVTRINEIIQKKDLSDSEKLEKIGKLRRTLIKNRKKKLNQ